MADNNTTPEYIIPDESVRIPLNKLLITDSKNFDYWLTIIQHIIYYLNQSNTGINEINDLLDKIKERNQITEYIEDRTETVGYGYDYNNYVRNGYYYIPFVAGTTLNYPSEGKSCFLCVYSLGNTDDLVQFAITKTEVPTIYFRSRIGNKWKSWTEYATKSYIDKNFLNKTTSVNQEVKANVKFDKNVTTETLQVNDISRFIGPVNKVSTSTSSFGVQEKNSENTYTIEVVNENLDVQHPNNYPLYSEYSEDELENTEYQIPLNIDLNTALCNINGTANYANFINPQNIVSTYDGNNMSDVQKNYPVSAKAVSDLFKYCETTYISKSGGNFEGIVNHSEDIFLRYISNINSNRTAALRSPDGQLNLQCQRITNLISTTKQCELYLEKEDVDSNEYNKNSAAFTYSFYVINWNINKIINGNSELGITDISTQNDRDNKTVVLNSNIGKLTLEENGNYIFIGNEELKKNISKKLTYTVNLFYNIVNTFNTVTPISYSNEYSFTISKLTGTLLSGTVTINSSHNEVFITKSNFESLPVVYDSEIAEESMIIDGSYIAPGSIINGYEYTENEPFDTVIGYRVDDVMNDDEKYIISTLAPGSVLKKGSYIAYGSVLNGGPQFVASQFLLQDVTVIGGEKVSNGINTYNINENNQFVIETENDTTTYTIEKDTDGNPVRVVRDGGTAYEVYENAFTIGTGNDATTYTIKSTITKLIAKSIIKTGSTIAKNSVINGILYTENEIVKGQYIYKNSMLKPISQIKVGSIIAPISRIDLSNDSNGLLISQRSIINPGSHIIAGSCIVSGSIINNQSYENTMYIPYGIQIISDTVILPGSTIKNGSVIAVGSKLNGITFDEAFVLQSINEYSGELTVAMIAPRMYISTYNNSKDEFSKWNEYKFATYHSNIPYNSTLWENDIRNIISGMNIDDKYKNDIFNDLPKLLNPIDDTSTGIQGFRYNNTFYTITKDVDGNINEISYVDDSENIIKITKDNISESENGKVTYTFNAENVTDGFNTYSIANNVFRTSTDTVATINENDVFVKIPIIDDVITIGSEKYSVGTNALTNLTTEATVNITSNMFTIDDVNYTLNSLYVTDGTNRYSRMHFKINNVLYTLNDNSVTDGTTNYEITNDAFGIDDITYTVVKNASETPTKIQGSNGTEYTVSKNQFIINNVIYTVKDAYVTDGTTNYSTKHFVITRDSVQTIYTMESVYVTATYPLENEMFSINDVVYTLIKTSVSSSDGKKYVITDNKFRIGTAEYVISGTNVNNGEKTYPIENNAFSVSTVETSIDEITYVFIKDYENNTYSEVVVFVDGDCVDVLSFETINSLEYEEYKDFSKTPYAGKYFALRTAYNAPQSIYDGYLYISIGQRSINLDKITIDILGKTDAGEPISKVLYDTSSGAVIEYPFTTNLFRYSNFVIRRVGNTYNIYFEYELATTANQYANAAEVLSEYIRFNFLSNGGENGTINVQTTTEEISLNIYQLTSSSCIIGARTRTGITKEGELGDPLYDLGCVEFNEDFTAIRLRKRNVTTFETIKADVSLILERTTFKPKYVEYRKWQDIPEAERPNYDDFDYDYDIPYVRSGMISLGTSDSKFDTIYTNTSPIETSDKNLKTNIKGVSSSFLDAWRNIKWVTYKLKDSVDQKGAKNARTHAGVIAQDVEVALSKFDLTKYGFFCKNTWDDEYSTEYVTVPKHTDEFGIERPESVKKIKTLVKKAGEQYSIRYQEMQAIENMYLRREIELLKEEIKALKEKIK